MATTCYRVANSEFLTQNRCELGMLVVEDHIEYINTTELEKGSFKDLRRGAWPEFIGDLKTIAKQEDADEAYDQAKAIYETAGDNIEIVSAEKEHIRLINYFKQLKKSLGYDIPRDAPERQAPGTTFPEWLDYKRNNLPELLDDLDDRGEWPAD